MTSPLVDPTSARHPRRHRLLLWLAAVAIAGCSAQADEPAPGVANGFEVEYLRFAIDHHFSALRMTELAAGTDAARDSPLANPAEGVANTPGFAATPAKAAADELKSMARMENRAQREEIAAAQRMLRDWYGTSHEPALSAEAQQQLQLLDSVTAGNDFDHTFMEVLSRHHFMIAARSNECLVAADQKHQELHRYCSGIQHAQVNAINGMREMLCTRFQICDYQPLQGLRGRHTGSQSEPGGQ